MKTVHRLITRSPRAVAARLAVLAVAGVLSACAGYVTGARANWDEKLKELCAKDGGVTIYGHIRITRAEIDRHVLPMTSDGKLGVPLKELARPDAPVYAERKTVYLNEWNPQVGRVEWTAFRRSDHVAVARWISYGRFGGDLPSPAHDSHFTCPEPKTIAADLQRLFVIEGGAK